MSPPARRPPSRFGRALVEATETEVAAFLAALLRARGRTVVVSGRRVVATDADGSQTTYAVVTGVEDLSAIDAAGSRGEAADAVDAVVVVPTTAGDAVPGRDRFGTGVRVLDGTDLHRLARDGVDETDARAACRDHLGVPFDRLFDESGRAADEPTGAHAEEPAEAPDGGLIERLPVPSVAAVAPVAVLLAALLVLGSLLSGTVVVLGLPGGDAAQSTDGGSGGTDDAQLPPYARPGAGGFPPGVGPGGIEATTSLLDAHERAVANASYELTVTYRRFDGGDVVAVRESTVTVEGRGLYAAARSTTGEFSDDPPTFVDQVAYANGSHVFERRGPPGDRWYRTYPVRPVDGSRKYAGRARRFLRWYLTVEESTVVDRFQRDGTTFFRLSLRGDPWPGIDNVTGRAVIDENGVVHRVTRRYEGAGREGRTASVSMVYREYGSATVEPPSWYDAAVNATRNETGRDDGGGDESPSESVGGDTEPEDGGDGATVPTGSGSLPASATARDAASVGR